MTKKQKKMLARIIISAIMLVGLSFVEVNGVLRFVLYMIPYLIVGYDILYKAYKGIVNHRVFDECFLMAVATIGVIGLALYTQSGDYVEAIAVMLFYQIGEWFQSYAVRKSRRNISELMDIRPDYAHVLNDGVMDTVDPDEVSVGSLIVVQPGEKVPLDGIVVKGDSRLNTSALTGESMPQEVHEHDEIISGCINLSGVLTIQTTKEFGESTVSKILDLVENASSRKSQSENFISKFAKVYTPIVVYSALALAFLPPLISMMFQHDPVWGQWIYRALTFLVMSCPCALVISIPLSFFAGIGGASREGVLIKGSNYLEALSKTKYVVFDKTGTLTQGRFGVNRIHSIDMDEQLLLEYVALAEVSSSHPISMSIKEAYGQSLDRKRVTSIEEISGHGIKACVDGKAVYVGNKQLMHDLHIDVDEVKDNGTIIYVAIDQRYSGYIVISDQVKEHSHEAIVQLKRMRIHKTVMLTGDRRAVGESVGHLLGIDEVHSELLPQDKVSILEKIMSHKKDKDKLAFVGDGINDAPVLARADIGIAMGAMGSDAAIEAADVVLMDDDPLKIVKAIRISRKCLKIVYQNIYFAIGIKVGCLILGALGIANMWIAIFADVGVMILAILNAMRALYVKNI